MVLYINVGMLIGGKRAQEEVIAIQLSSASSFALLLLLHSVLAILMGLMAICLEVGLPAVVNLSGPQRHHWYNNYAVRGIYFFLMGVLTLPDSNWSW
jgi:hypothetical protein